MMTLISDCFVLIGVALQIVRAQGTPSGLLTALAVFDVLVGILSIVMSMIAAGFTMNGVWAFLADTPSTEPITDAPRQVSTPENHIRVIRDEIEAPPEQNIPIAIESYDHKKSSRAASGDRRLLP